MTATATDTEAFLEQFPAIASGNAPLWLNKARKAARDSFASQGLPTIHDEEWRHTNIAPLLKTSLAPAPISAAAAIQDARLAPLFAPVDGPRMVFINGRYAPRLSKVTALPAGVQVKALSEILLKHPGKLEHSFTDVLCLGHPFAALNAAQFEDGAYIELDAKAVFEQPIQILHYATVGASFPRTVIVAGESARARVIEIFAGEGAYFCNASTEIGADKNASVELSRIQRESETAFHTGLLQTRQARDSRVAVQSLALGGAIARVEFDSRLNGPGAEINLAGLYLGHGKQHLDQHIVVDHAQPRGTSRQFFRGVMDEKSRGVFSGKVIVRPGAQKTDAQQQNNNLLLSDDAVVDTKPQLEIYADDVKCSHGATSGKLDAEALFFLRSRGLSARDARALLTLAFAGEVVGSIKDESLRGYLESLVTNRLKTKN
ncbi:MAG: Fe-S cluster assembly protein SufD [Planctomycetes bacterium]|nr:Fe-S cluster assembly protein SufD [Planctomycetota bacterium]